MKVKFRNIAVSGLTGSGKSTLANKLADKLGWKVLSTGKFIRVWHEENKVPLVEPDKIPEEVDKKIDFGYQKLMQSDSNVIFESRLAGWLSKNDSRVFKVLVKCDPMIAARRISHRDGVDGEKAMREAGIREGLLKDKFIRLYDAGDYLDEENFSLVIDTGKVNADEALGMVLENVIEK